MHILHVISSMAPVNGRPSQGIRNLDKPMKELGIHREVVCLDAPDSPYLGTDEFKVHALGIGQGPWRYEAHLVTWLTTNIYRFDVVIVNGLWQYHSYATWKVINRLKKNRPFKIVPRVFVMPHGMLDPYFQLAKERWLKAVRNRIYWKLIESKIVNNADGLLFTCETELLLARSTFKNYNPRKEFNVGYGVEVPPPYSLKMTIDFNTCCPGLNNEPYLLFLGRIHSKKGVDLLLEAYSRVYKLAYAARRKLPKLVIAGPGLNNRFGKRLLKQLSKTSEIEKDVFFPGMLTGDAKWGAFYGCEAFILPSHQENFGIAVVEAMACEKPVLITNRINIWQTIMTGSGGIVENDDLNGVQNMLTKWIDLSEEEQVKMCKRAADVYKNNFTIHQSAINLLTVLKDRDYSALVEG